MKIIAVDFDDTIAQSLSHLLAIYNKKYNDHLTRDDITSWDLPSFVKCGHDIFSIFDQDDFFDGVQPVTGCIPILERLKKEYDIYITTSTGGYLPSIAGKISWLQRHLPFIDRHHWVFCGKKNIIHADYMVDDAPHNLEVFTGKPILFSAPHNLKETRFPHRASTWEEVYQIIKEN